MEFLRSNTPIIKAVGPFYDKTDGVTIETSLTITNERITLVAETDAGSAPTLILDNITGATSGTANDLNYITSGDNGMMQIELAAADVNRVGRMKLSITDAANHVPVFHNYFVLPQAIFDWITGVIVPLPANVTQISSDATAADNLEAEYDGTGYKSYLRRFTAQAGGTATITLDASASATDDVYNGLGVAVLSGTGAGQVRLIPGAAGSYVGSTKVAAVNRAWVTNPSSSSVCILFPFDLEGIIAEIVANVATAADLVQEMDDTSTKLQNIDDQSRDASEAMYALQPEKDNIGATGNDTTHVHLPSLTYADDQINNQLLLLYDNSGVILYSRWIEDWVNATKLATVAALPVTPEASVDYFYLTTIRRDVTGVAGLDAAGMRAAVGLASANLDTQIGDLPTNAELATSQAAADDATLSALAVVDGIVDSILVDTAEIGAAGAGLTAINLPNQTMDIVGNITGNLSGSVGSVTGAVGSVTGAVGSVTGAVGSVTGGATAAALSVVDGIVDDILVDTAVIGVAGAGLTAVPWNATWDAEVESEVNDAIDTVIAELGVAAPTATPTLRTGMMLMYMALRNQLKVQTSGTDAIEVYNNAGTKIAAKAITDDGSDYTEAKMA